MNLLAHDLLWGKRITVEGSQPLEEWVSSRDPSLPVVVRRDRRDALIPVGVRGRQRSQRLAAWAASRDIVRHVTPLQLVQSADVRRGWRSHPLAVFRCLDDVDHLCREHRLPWGITGSLAYELATGLSCAHAESDIDITLRPSLPVSKERLTNLSRALDGLPHRVDAQVETALGAFALREWVSISGSVLLKTDSGPFLTTDPWGATVGEPGVPCAPEARLTSGERVP